MEAALACLTRGKEHNFECISTVRDLLPALTFLIRCGFPLDVNYVPGAVSQDSSRATLGQGHSVWNRLKGILQQGIQDSKCFA